ncbi:ABC transporter substrate-binding protein [Hyalangium rubrum]|uniref:ABC transporter substrate-binding protein n=1 Tax=Hyalangium rubrum TaxID=3103134 RepID=A0ABU5HIQ8_9BACT|nr:ABC transporter substrate-binding protein [Hyalangium sp. s54d21]MDY7232708.1 ABC transporter substrate-binding protein [Hyalangium sp. s54d21]
MHRSFSMLFAALALAVVACEKKPEAASTPVTGSPPVEAKASRPDDAESIRVGAVGSLTGSEASFGISARNGIELAINEANEAGGVKGKKLVVRMYDSQGRPEEAAQAVTRLIAQDQVAVIIGESASSVSMAMAEKAQAAGVPQIAYTSTAPEVTQKGDYIFRVCFIDPFQGRVMAKFSREHLKLSQVAVLTDNKSAYSIGLGKVFIQEFEQQGGKVTAHETYSKGDTDFRAQLTAIKQTKPEAVFVPGYYTDAGLIARQARELGLKVPLLGGDGWNSDKLFELGGSALDGSYYSNHYALDNPDPLLTAFVEKYQKIYGVPPDSSAALAYDATKLAVDAMKRAPDLSGKALRDAIAATKDFPGVAGKITINANRDAEKQAVVLKVENGKLSFVTTVQP